MASAELEGPVEVGADTGTGIIGSVTLDAIELRDNLDYVGEWLA